MIPVPVTAPPRRRHRFSLLDTADIIRPDYPNWEQRGVAFTEEGCNVIFAHNHDCWVNGATGKGLQECTGIAEFPAYVLEITMAWPIGDANGNPKKLISDAIEIGGSAVMERVLEKGIVDTANIQALLPIALGAQSTTGVVGHKGTLTPPNFSTAFNLGTAVAAVALGMVEKKLIDGADHIGGAGTIYMNPAVAARIAGGPIYVDDGRLWTYATGSEVIVGNFADDKIYGHVGGIDVYLAEPNPSNAVDRGINEEVFQVEQSFALAYDTCTLVSATVNLDPTGT